LLFLVTNILSPKPLTNYMLQLITLFVIIIVNKNMTNNKDLWCANIDLW